MNKNALLWGVLLAGAAGTATFVYMNAKKQPHNRHNKGHDSQIWLGSSGHEILTALTAIFLNTKKGKEVKRYLSRTFGTIQDQTQSIVDKINETGNEIVNGVEVHTAEWAEKALSAAEVIVEEIKVWAETIREAAEKARKHAEKMKSNPRYSEKIEELLNWVEQAIETADSVSESAEEWVRSLRKTVRSKKGKKSESQIDSNITADVIEWAMLGMNIWKSATRK